MSGDIPTRCPTEFFLDFCHGEMDMIEADNVSKSIYQVLRMSRAAMTHLLIIRCPHLAKNGRGHPFYTSGTYQQMSCRGFKSLYHVKMDDCCKYACNVITEEKRRL